MFSLDVEEVHKLIVTNCERSRRYEERRERAEPKMPKVEVNLVRRI